MNTDCNPPPLRTVSNFANDLRPPLLPRGIWRLMVALLVVITALLTVMSALMIRSQWSLERWPWVSFETLRSEPVYAVSIYGFEDTSGTSVGSNSFRTFHLSHVKTCSSPDEIESLLVGIRSSAPNDWNHYAAGHPLFLVFNTNSGPKEFYAEVLGRFPDDLWISTGGGNQGVLAPGLGAWLRKTGVTAQMGWR